MPELATSRVPVSSSTSEITSSRYCTFSALADTSSPSTFRTATLEGSDYLCIPVIALIGNATIRPLGSTAPEFVPASELAQLPQQWNTRPVVLNHPSDGSACTPQVLEASRFGHIFNSKYEDGKLKLEAWLSREKASKVGPDAERLIELCESGGMVEVSIGAWVTLSHSPGTYNNQPYTYIWSDIVSDHIAFLTEGSLGACSNSMGCGAPRLMQAREGESNMTVPVPDEKKDNSKNKSDPSKSPSSPNLLTRLLSALGLRSLEMPDTELRDKLWEALRRAEPGFDWIHRIWPESKIIVYSTFAEGTTFWWKRSYNIQQEGTAETVSLADDRVQVEPPDGNDLEDWKEIRAAESGKEEKKEKKEEDDSSTPAPTVMRAACECEKDKKQDTNSNNEKGDLTMAENAAPKTDTPKTDAPAPPETPVTTPPATPEPPATKGEEKKDSATPPSNLVSIPAEEYADIKACAGAYKQQQIERKAAIVLQLKQAQTAFDENDLKALSLDQLEKMSKALNVNRPVYDYSGVGLPMLASAQEEELAPLPDPWGLNVDASSKKGAN